MKRYLLLILLTCVAVLVEAVPSIQTVYGVRPEMTLVLAVFLAFGHDWPDIVLPLFVVGLVRDVYSQYLFGYYAGTYLATGIVVASMRQAIFRHNPVSQAVLTALASLAVNLPAALACAFGDAGTLAGAAALWLGLAAYTGLVAPIGFFFLNRVRWALSFERLWQIGRSPGMPRRFAR